MAFAETQLTKITEGKPAVGKSHGRQIWHYEAGDDAVATVVTAGYFNAARGLLNVGDRIHLVAASETAFRVLKVSAVPKTSGNVTATALAFS